jgi:hypothetical protein
MIGAEINAESERQAAAMAAIRARKPVPSRWKAASPKRAREPGYPTGCGLWVAGVISAVHSGQRRAAMGMLMVHSGQSLMVAAWFRSNSLSRRLTGSTMA